MAAGVKPGATVGFVGVPHAADIPAAEAYRAMDERRAVKVLLRP